MDVPDYIRSIRDGNYEKGLQLMYLTNPFPATCGRIWTRRCESVCPVGIQGDLVVYAAEEVVGMEIHAVAGAHRAVG